MRIHPILSATALFIASLSSADAMAADADHLVLADGRVLTGDDLGGDAQVVRFGIGSSVQELPHRLVKQVRRAGCPAESGSVPCEASAPPRRERGGAHPLTTAAIPDRCDAPPPCADPVVSPPCRRWAAPCATSGWTLTYAVGSSWGRRRHGSWGVGWGYGMGVPFGWRTPSPWCR